jgi:protease I
MSLSLPPLLNGKKIAILMESDYIEYEVTYYRSRFAEEGAEVHFLSKLWGQPSLTFHGHEYQAPFVVDKTFTDMDDMTLRSYAAVIVPGGFVSDRLRYTPDPDTPSDAVTFLKRAFAEPSILKGVICHGMWLLSWAPELVSGKRAVVHPNLVADARNMGIQFVNEDTVVDGDLVTGRTGGHHGPFSRKIIELLAGDSKYGVTQ